MLVTKGRAQVLREFLEIRKIGEIRCVIEGPGIAEIWCICWRGGQELLELSEIRKIVEIRCVCDRGLRNCVNSVTCVK